MFDLIWFDLRRGKTCLTLIRMTKDGNDLAVFRDFMLKKVWTVEKYKYLILVQDVSFQINPDSHVENIFLMMILTLLEKFQKARTFSVLGRSASY